LTLTIKQERNCVRYLPPVSNIFTTSVAHSSLVMATRGYPAPGDAGYDPQMYPDPLNFQGLKFTNLHGFIIVDPLLQFKEEKFTSDKQCVVDRCVIYEWDTASSTCSRSHTRKFVRVEKEVGNTHYTLAIWTGYDDGYDVTFCTRCWVRQMALTSEPYRIVGRANCAVSLRGIAKPAILYRYYQDDSTSPTNGIIDWRELFMNWDETYCAVSTCSLYRRFDPVAQACQGAPDPKTTNMTLIETYPNFQIKVRTDHELGWQESACLSCTNPLQTYHVPFVASQKLACKRSLAVLPQPDVIIPFVNVTTQYIVGNGYTDHFTNARPVDCAFSQCTLMTAGCTTPFNEPNYITIETASPWRVKLVQNIHAGYERQLCYKCTNGRASVTQGWRLVQRYDCREKMKAVMIMDSAVATQQDQGIFSYFVVAGSPSWYLNFRTRFETPYCPTTLTGMRVQIDAADHTEHKFLNFTKSKTVDMAGRFDSADIGKFSSATTYNMTVDLFDPNDPYLDVRAAIVKLHIIELNKTNPRFVGPLDEKQTVEIGTDAVLALPPYVYFNTDAGDTVKMSLAFRSDNTEQAVSLDQSTKKITVSAAEATKLGVHKFKITLLEEATGLDKVYDFEFTVLAAGTQAKLDEE